MALVPPKNLGRWFRRPGDTAGKYTRGGERRSSAGGKVNDTIELRVFCAEGKRLFLQGVEPFVVLGVENEGLPAGASMGELKNLKE
jgi:hypothetical protein